MAFFVFFVVFYSFSLAFPLHPKQKKAQKNQENTGKMRKNNENKQTLKNIWVFYVFLVFCWLFFLGLPPPPKTKQKNTKIAKKNEEHTGRMRKNKETQAIKKTCVFYVFPCFLLVVFPWLSSSTKIQTTKIKKSKEKPKALTAPDVPHTGGGL